MVSAVVGSALNLAINGGTPVRCQPMPARHALGPQEKAMMDEVYDWYHRQGLDPGYQGYFEEQYCQAITDTFGGGYADAVATGTAALYVALAALDLPKASDVLVSPITDPGTLSAIILHGLRPKLIDTQAYHYNIGFSEVASRLDEAVSCVLIVHAAGQGVADIERLVDFCHQNGVKVLEDCSQAHGAKVNGQLVGTLGDIAAFSTMYRKASTMGPTGGFIYSRNESYYRQALAHADRGKPRWIEGFDDRDPSQFLFPALNLHASEMACAIGLASWKRLPETITRRQQFVAGLTRRLSMESRVCRVLPPTAFDSPFYQPIFVDLNQIQVTKIDFAKAVLAEGIGLNPHYRYLVEDWPWVRPYLADEFRCQRAREARDASFCVYLNEHYGEQEWEDIVSAILKVEQYFST